jgi:hypothetical protein
MSTPMERRLAAQAYDKRVEAEAEQRRQAHEEWMKEQLDPAIRTMRQLRELTQRMEAAELEFARLSFLLERKEP